MIRVLFGWDAPSMKEQFPTLSDDDAERFDKDSEALTRLRIRGYLSDNQRESVMKKISRAIADALEDDDE